MRIGVFGTGMAARAIAGRLAELGHEVMIGTRDVDQTMARAEPSPMGDPPFASWHATVPKVTLGTFDQAAAHGELLVNATAGAGSLDALERAGADNLDDKVLIDLANPLDYSHGTPPSLLVANSDSLAEQIQRTYPGLRVVKTLNTVAAPLMVDPSSVADGEHTVFVSGDDTEAKAQVTELLQDWLGWKHVLDLGGIETARAAEMYLPLWIAMLGKLKTPMFNIAIVA
jgi:predicted dinucleotide-binding enzyme